MYEKSYHWLIKLIIGDSILINKNCYNHILTDRYWFVTVNLTFLLLIIQLYTQKYDRNHTQCLNLLKQGQLYCMVFLQSKKDGFIFNNTTSPYKWNFLLCKFSGYLALAKQLFFHPRAVFVQKQPQRSSWC